MRLSKAVSSILLACGIVASVARADIVSDWNIVTTDIIYEAIKPPPVANRTLALVQTSAYIAANAISGKYSPGIEVVAPDNASIEAAVAAASSEALKTLLPDYAEQVDKIYQTELAKLPDNENRSAGVEVGMRAARIVFDMRSGDKPSLAKDYRPVTSPGTYIPTVVPAAVGWAESRNPWALTSVSQFRPGPPPPLNSQRWADDYNEILQMGASDSTVRTADQTAAAMFWQATAPKVYMPVVRSVTEQPGRDLTRNARLLAAVSQGTDDALAAVFDAKHTYQFWRPFTAIRNGDQDGNDATPRRADWKPLIDTPMHPEYPCAHCIVAATVGRLIEADLGSDPIPLLETQSPGNPDITRSWNSVDEFIAEVSNARVWEGVHYRHSAEVAQQMGKQIADAVMGSGLMQ